MRQRVRYLIINSRATSGFLLLTVQGARAEGRKAVSGRQLRGKLRDHRVESADNWEKKQAQEKARVLRRDQQPVDIQTGRSLPLQPGVILGFDVVRVLFSVSILLFVGRSRSLSHGPRGEVSLSDAGCALTKHCFIPSKMPSGVRNKDGSKSLKTEAKNDAPHSSITFLLCRRSGESEAKSLRVSTVDIAYLRKGWPSSLGFRGFRFPSSDRGYIYKSFYYYVLCSVRFTCILTFGYTNEEKL